MQQFAINESNPTFGNVQVPPGTLEAIMANAEANG